MSTATTPKGYIKPNGDDPITNGDNVIATLADQVDANLGRSATGSVVIPITVIGTAGSVVVTFPAGRFTAGPIVTVTYASTNPHGGAVGASAAATATSVTIYGTKVSGSVANITATWHAIQV